MAMRTIELLYGAEILAIVVLKDGEISFIPRQGMEAHVAETLASIDWASAVRIVKEHYG
jgi:hypothetical protein